MDKPTILYIDDEPDALKAISLGLQDRGFNVMTASSGAQGLEILHKVTINLIITDLRMQPMNGFELFQEVKKIKKNKKTPFFFLTAVNDSLAEKYGQKLGIDAYITKPVDLDDLVLAIQNKLAAR
jgi:DNA-binding response OmpR family regulator